MVRNWTWPQRCGAHCMNANYHRVCLSSLCESYCCLVKAWWQCKQSHHEKLSMEDQSQGSWLCFCYSVKFDVEWYGEVFTMRMYVYYDEKDHMKCFQITGLMAHIANEVAKVAFGIICEMNRPPTCQGQSPRTFQHDTNKLSGYL